MFEPTVPRSRTAVAVAVAAVLVGATGVLMTTHALMARPRARAPMVRTLESRELPAGIPDVLQPDAMVIGPVVDMLDSLRRMDRSPRNVKWLHFRCIAAATVLTAEPTGDANAFRKHVLAAFPESWTRGSDKDAEYLRSPDGRTEIAIPARAGRDAVDELAAALRPSRILAFAYHLRPC